MSEENIMSVFRADDGERRPYNLNVDRSLRKKLEAAKRLDIEVKCTGGGVRLWFSAAAYELVKAASVEYYGGVDERYRYEATNIKDRQGNIVEYKVKVFAGKTHLYTFNMYHTKSSCLINGKSVERFMMHDFKNITTMADSYLQSQGITTLRMNDIIRTQLELYIHGKSNDVTQTTAPALFDANEDVGGSSRSVPVSTAGNTRSTCDVTVPLMDNSSSNTNHVSQAEQQTDVNNNDAANSHITIDDVYKLCFNMSLAIEDLRHSVDRQLADLMDKITSVKNHSSVTINNGVDRLADTIQEQVNSATTTLHKQIQSTQDSVRSLHDKSQFAKSTITGSVNPITSEPVPEIDLCSPARPTSSQIHRSTPVTPNPSQHRLPTNNRNDRQQRNICGTKDKTLLIGDSIFKVINKRGLKDNIDVISIGGATVGTLSTKLSTIDSRQYSNVVIYCGGNDVSAGTEPEPLRETLVDVVTSLQDQGCAVYLCSVCPRQDCDLIEFRDTIGRVCWITGANHIDCHSSFVYGDTRTVRHFYERDGIHLNNMGARTLVSCLNNSINIIKKSIQRQSQSNNHYQYQRWEQQRSRVRCYSCGKHGHSAKNCRSSQNSRPNNHFMYQNSDSFYRH